MSLDTLFPDWFMEKHTKFRCIDDFMDYCENKIGKIDLGNEEIIQKLTPLVQCKTDFSSFDEMMETAATIPDNLRNIG